MRRRAPALALALVALSAWPGRIRAAEPVPPAAPEAPAPAGPAAAGAELAGRPVAEVVIEGLVTVEPKEVRKVMATRVGLPFHPATYREDFSRIYNLGFFDNVILQRPEPTPAGLRVRVTCQERPVVDAVELRGNKKFGTRVLLEAARAPEGEPEKEPEKGKGKGKEQPVLAPKGRYDAYVAYRMVRALEEFYIEKSYPLAKIEAKTEPVAGRPGHVLAVFEIKEERPVDITRAVFRGRSALKEKQLRAAIRSKPGGWFSSSGPYDPDALRLDALRLQDLYHNSGYSDARVTVLDPEISAPAGWRRRRRATVSFQIEEGRKYVYGPVSFTGLSLAPEQTARKRLGLQLGKPYSEEEVDQARRRLEALLGEYGRPFARALARRQDTGEPGVTALSFQVSEGPEATVEEVRIKGNTFTKDRIIRRELELFPGDIYDSRKLGASERNLRRLGLFKKVSARAEPGDEPATADLEIEVQETETSMLQVGAFVNPEDGSVGGSAMITLRNLDWRNPPKSWEDWVSRGAFRGGGQTLSLRAMVSETSQYYSLDFANPWIWDTPEHYGFGFSLFDSISQYEDFNLERLGASVKLGRRLFHPRLRGYVQYKIQQVYMNGVDDAAPEVLKDEEGTTLFSSGKVGLVFSTVDDLIAPTKGVNLEASEEVFGSIFGGDKDIRKTALEGDCFLPLFRTWDWAHVLHLRLMADWANAYGRSDVVPPSERFFAGGIGTVRGYENRTISPRIGDYAVGGDFMLVESLEYIFPLYQDTFRGVVFFDVGGVWADEGDFNFDDLHDTERRSVGLGFLIKTPPAMGQVPIKLYFSRALNPQHHEHHQLFQMSFSFLF